MNLKAWIGRSEEAGDLITATPCAALAALLDRPPERPAAGTPLPPLWHWLYFLPLHRQSELGPDGHARRGGFLPPVTLPRRMWAGSQFEFRAPLCIGDQVVRRSVIDNVTEKSGRNGPLIFVRVRHELRRQGEAAAALTEFHDIVYRPEAVAGEAPPPASRPELTARWQRSCVADPVLLFRFSALTFNGHRIHYDRSYAREVEGYPGLVVHGPLLATWLIDLVRRELPAAQLSRFEFRALRPLFDQHPFTLNGAPAADGRTVRLWATDHEGWLVMDASATLA